MNIKEVLKEVIYKKPLKHNLEEKINEEDGYMY